jgi:hypothetical protein
MNIASIIHTIFVVCFTLRRFIFGDAFVTVNFCSFGFAVTADANLPGLLAPNLKLFTLFSVRVGVGKL